MVSPEILQLGALALGAIAVSAMAFALAYPYFSGDRQADKRRKTVTENRADRKARVVQVEETANRKQAVADTLKEIEERQQAKQKETLRIKLLRAGLDISTNMFWALPAQ